MVIFWKSCHFKKVLIFAENRVSLSKLANYRKSCFNTIFFGTKGMLVIRSKPQKNEKFELTWYGMAILLPEPDSVLSFKCIPLLSKFASKTLPCEFLIAPRPICKKTW